MAGPCWPPPLTFRPSLLCTRLSAQQKKVRSAALESDPPSAPTWQCDHTAWKDESYDENEDKTRYRELQDLILSWQDQIWGPGPALRIVDRALLVRSHSVLQRSCCCSASKAVGRWSPTALLPPYFRQPTYRPSALWRTRNALHASAVHRTCALTP